MQGSDMKLYLKSEVDALLRKELGNNNLHENLLPIELPSNEEINNESEFQDGRGRCEFIKGAEWMRNTIKNRAIHRNESILSIKK